MSVTIGIYGLGVCCTEPYVKPLLYNIVSPYNIAGVNIKIVRKYKGRNVLLCI